LLFSFFFSFALFFLFHQDFLCPLLSFISFKYFFPFYLFLTLFHLLFFHFVSPIFPSFFQFAILLLFFQHILIFIILYNIVINSVSLLLYLSFLFPSFCPSLSFLSVTPLSQVKPNQGFQQSVRANIFVISSLK
jgi:hypothetical protein